MYYQLNGRILVVVLSMHSAYNCIHRSTSTSWQSIAGVTSSLSFSVMLSVWLLLYSCPQIPNPLFDLAGITCGHFLVPFWTFFGATLIGKAVFKMLLQVQAHSRGATLSTLLLCGVARVWRGGGGSSSAIDGKSGGFKKSLEEFVHYCSTAALCVGWCDSLELYINKLFLSCMQTLFCIVCFSKNEIEFVMYITK